MERMGRTLIGAALGLLLPAPFILAGLWIVVMRPIGPNPLWGSGLVAMGLLVSPFTVVAGAARMNANPESRRPSSPLPAAGLGAAIGATGGAVVAVLAAVTGGVHGTHLPDWYVMTFFVIACVAACAVLGGVAGASVAVLRSLFH